MANTTYTTKQGDRWDLIAHQAYNDATQIDIIIDANPNVPITDELEPSIVLNIPIIDAPEIDNSFLPPWKRP